MGRIVHIALKCENRDNLEAATKFYEEIFGIYQTKNKHARGHLSRHMTDGNIDLALMLYDSEEEKEAKLAGAGARIHHIGIEVDDRPSMIQKIEENGGSIFSDRAEGALKYFSPDGTLGEIVAPGRYPKKDRSELSRIAHVALKVNDLERATSFYENVFGFRQVSTSEKGSQTSRKMTDGETTITLLSFRDEGSPEAQLAGEGPGIQYWGLEVSDPQTVANSVEQYGGVILPSPQAGVVRFRGPDGNVAELQPRNAGDRAA